MTWFTRSFALAPRFSPTAADLALKAEEQRKYVKDLWIFLASVVAFLTAVRAVRLALSLAIRPRSTTPQPSEKHDPEAAHARHNGRVSLRRLPMALASVFRVVAFRLNIPIGPGSVASVTELTFVLGYIATMLIILLINTNDLDTWFYEDRAAHLASCQLPLIVALAGKNNIISWLTGVSHEKLNILHRAAARTCLMFLWLHAIARASAGLPEQFDFTHGWMRWGALGLTAFTLAAILSLRPIRNAFFEFFLISHIVLIGIFLIAGFLHTRHPGFGEYVWPALVVWAFDRVLRGGRLVWNNRFGLSKQKHHCTATAELISADTVRLTLRRCFKWKPGQHAYVILPTVSSLPTEAHPFTIASIPESLDAPDESKERDVVFLIRAREGFTGRLRELAVNGATTVPALVDGPYGCPPDLTRFSTSILVAGGSGVSYTLPLLLNLVRQAKLGKSAVRRVVFVWSVREADHVRWISQVLGDALMAAQSTGLAVDPRVYITGSTPPTPPLPVVGYSDSDRGSVNIESPISEKDVKMSLPAYSALRILHGRPSIRKVLQEEISASAGPVSVDVAGPSGLSQSVAQALASDITSSMGVLRGAPSVSLHVETFGMTR
ncbi:ferric reductase family protein [Phanerochaete sordida]|uniref:ferric-chelate reductase (NADPH) n=1 Tax=Phanerochaete sordida TaxID=48140 RepID=A0A9P3L7Y8_9APHY|nr:ferric reductase family protein [Phanerochaete sordida]